MDVTRQEEFAAVVDEARPDVVLHLAAISHVPDAQGNPGRAYEVNTVGTVRLLAEVGAPRAGRATRRCSWSDRRSSTAGTTPARCHS